VALPNAKINSPMKCHERCKQSHLLHITLAIKFFDRIIKLDDANHPWILIGSFGDSIHVFHVSQQWCGDKPCKGTCFKIWGLFPKWWLRQCGWFESQPKPSKTTSDNNHMFHVFKLCVSSMMSPNLNLDVSPRTFNNQSLLNL
jgi:hypothetical protein